MLGSTPSTVMVPIRQQAVTLRCRLPDGLKALNPSREAADKTISFIALQIKMRQIGKKGIHPSGRPLSMRQTKPSVFVSYSQKDKVEREHVKSFLDMIDTCLDADIWVDDRIDAGAEWYSEIQKAIDRSAVAVLLLTKNFLGTDFIIK
jgi:predicted nucleotide-binding protein